MTYISQLPQYDLTNKRVIVRADLNVPLNNGTIVDDYRLQAILPTLDLIRAKGGLITLMAHIGRPKKQEPALSTKLLINWFAQKNYHLIWAKDIERAQELTASNENKIVLLENLRFFPEEKNHDAHFAQKLSTLGTFYVNDAFGALHRDDTSITLLPKLFLADHRTIGLLVEKELSVLAALVTNPKEPFVIILGGGKVKDKLPVIENLLNHAQAILLCPAIVATFLKAMGKEVGKSLVDDTALDACKAIIKKAANRNIQLSFPLDFLIAHGTITGPIETIDIDSFPQDGIALSIGPKTIENYAATIRKANTIFYNAAMGFLDIPESLKGTHALLQAIANAQAFSVVGGGDSVAAVQRARLSSSIDFLSTGGGATLTYLSGKKLPGLDAIYNECSNK